MNQVFKKLRKDFRGYFFRKVLRYNSLSIKMFVTTFFIKVSLKLKNIEFGKNIRFYKKCIFVRFPESKIRIGDDCVFVSDPKMNLAGINRYCSVSTLKKGAEIIIGDNTRFSGAVIGAAERISIGNNVLVGANAFITDYDWHNIDPAKRHLECEGSAPVEVCDNVWIGINAVILKGVRIGKNSVIGANSVVTNDIPENVIAAGNPCKVIKAI